MIRRRFTPPSAQRPTWDSVAESWGKRVPRKTDYQERCSGVLAERMPSVADWRAWALGWMVLSTFEYSLAVNMGGGWCQRARPGGRSDVVNLSFIKCRLAQFPHGERDALVLTERRQKTRKKTRRPALGGGVGKVTGRTVQYRPVGCTRTITSTGT